MKRILVGVDASQHSLDALRQAVEEARLRGGTLEVLYAFEPPDSTTAFPILPEMGENHADVEVMRQHANDQLGAWLDETGVDLSDLEVTWTVVPDRKPSRALIERSADADLVVVGSRGRGGFAGLRLGSVSEQVTRHAQCPVLVVRRRSSS